VTGADFMRSSTSCLRNDSRTPDSSGTLQPVSDEAFASRLAEAPEEEVDEETVARIVSAEPNREGASLQRIEATTLLEGVAVLREHQ
jgi:hypothetical protein